jgi:plasmid stabilization system protein
MEYKYQFTSHAEKDLDDILSYLEFTIASPTATKNFLKKLRLTLSNICLFPNSYKLIQNKYINNIRIRKALVMQYILYYSIDSLNNRIIIIRFSHSEQNEDDFFKNNK